LKALSLGADALKTVMASKDLSVESAEATMDYVADVLADHQDIEESIHQGLKDMNVDPELFENELEALLKQAQEQEAQKKLESLPPVAKSELVDQLIDDVANLKMKETVKEEKKAKEEKLVAA
jgi:hypothetical protein